MRWRRSLPRATKSKISSPETRSSSPARKGSGSFLRMWPPPTACRARTCGLRASGSTFARFPTTCPTTSSPSKSRVGSAGDCWDRWYVRLAEIRQSARIIQQAIDGIPSGPLQAKVPKIIKVPKGETYVRAENPKGEMGYYLVSDGGQGPYRLKIRSASFSNISILPWILEGALIPDIIAIMGSLDFVLGDVDR